MRRLNESSRDDMDWLVQWVERALTPVGLDACIMGSAMLIDILAEAYRIPAFEQPCEVVVANAAATKLMQEGVPTEDPRWGQNGEAVYLMSRQGRQDIPGKWMGHLVAVTEHWVLDSTLGQANRPDKGILSSSVVFQRKHEAGLTWPEAEYITLISDQGVSVTYQTTTDTSYRTALDWFPEMRLIVMEACLRTLEGSDDPNPLDVARNIAIDDGLVATAKFLAQGGKLL